jgi:hypothetical protein
MDFELNNLRLQCVGCNHFRSGNLEVFIPKLIKEIGLKRVEELRVTKHQVKKYTREELEAIIEGYK